MSSLFTAKIFSRSAFLLACSRYLHLCICTTDQSLHHNDSDSIAHSQIDAGSCSLIRIASSASQFVYFPPCPLSPSSSLDPATKNSSFHLDTLRLRDSIKVPRSSSQVFRTRWILYFTALLCMLVNFAPPLSPSPLYISSSLHCTVTEPPLSKPLPLSFESASRSTPRTEDSEL